jgi:cell division septation protein DedD
VPTPAGSDPTTVAPPPAVDELSYFNRLEKPNATEEPLKPPPTVPAAAPASAVAPIEKAAVPSPAKAQEPRAEQPGSGYAVQIAALNVRSEADGIAKRLNSKGYAAYVLAPSGGTPAVFRVRVGKFGTRREAEAVAARLQKEEQFKPWVTR